MGEKILHIKRNKKSPITSLLNDYFDYDKQIATCNKPRESIRNSLLDAMGVPKKLQNFRIGDLDGESYKIAKDLHDNIFDYLKTGLSILISGANGSGKSALAVILMQASIIQYKSAYYTMYDDYLVEHRKNNEDYDYAINNKEILVLDEVGKEIDNKSGYNKVAIENLVRKRENKGLITILVTNLSPKQFRAYYGDSLCCIFDDETNKVFVKEYENRRGRKVGIWEK